MSIRSRLDAVMRVPPLPFHPEAVSFLEQHCGRAILGDDMGLGKTYETIAYLALHPEIRPAVIVCPATIKWKWQREFKEFAGIKSTVLDGFKPYGVHLKLWKEQRGDGTCYRTSRWFTSPQKRREWVADNVERIKVMGKSKIDIPPMRDVVILNFDIGVDWLRVILEDLKPKFLGIDECHEIKNEDTIRAKVCQAIGSTCPHVVPMSGTPITNRPSEFFTVLNMVAPDKFPSPFHYKFRYCAPKKGFRGKWDFSGASNLAELHGLVSQVMIRRLKKDVMKDLPQKMESVIPVDLSNREEYEEARDAFTEWLLQKRGAEAVRRARSAEALVRLGVLKRLSAEGKVAAYHAWATDWQAQTGQKLVTFAVHKAVVRMLMELDPKGVKIVGGVQPHERQAIVDRFQNDATCRNFYGNIKAAGQSITLTASSTVALLELGWTPGSMDQATDRVLRIGQKADKMNAYIFIGRDTVDEDHLEVLNEKRKVVGQVLDGEAVEHEVQYRIIDNLIQKRKESEYAAG